MSWRTLTIATIIILAILFFLVPGADAGAASQTTGYGVYAPGWSNQGPFLTALGAQR